MVCVCGECGECGECIYSLCVYMCGEEVRDILSRQTIFSFIKLFSDFSRRRGETGMTVPGICFVNRIR